VHVAAETQPLPLVVIQRNPMSGSGRGRGELRILASRLRQLGFRVRMFNVPRYGFGLPFAIDAKPDDHLLDVRAFHGQTRWLIFWHAFKLRLGLPLRSDEVSRFTTTSLSIRLADPERRLPSQCDGDPGPSLPLLIEIEPRSLTLMSP